MGFCGAVSSGAAGREIDPVTKPGRLAPGALHDGGVVPLAPGGISATDDSPELLPLGGDAWVAADAWAVSGACGAAAVGAACAGSVAAATVAGASIRSAGAFSAVFSGNTSMSCASLSCGPPKSTKWEASCTPPMTM